MGATVTLVCRKDKSHTEEVAWEAKSPYENTKHSLLRTVGKPCTKCADAVYMYWDNPFVPKRAPASGISTDKKCRRRLGRTSAEKWCSCPEYRTCVACCP